MWRALKENFWWWFIPILVVVVVLLVIIFMTSDGLGLAPFIYAIF
jgi:uncharacterized membrane protein YhaH (DUF805 family)